MGGRAECADMGERTPLSYSRNSPCSPPNNQPRKHLHATYIADVSMLHLFEEYNGDHHKNLSESN
jgi:hypothetical protein